MHEACICVRLLEKEVTAMDKELRRQKKINFLEIITYASKLDLLSGSGQKLFYYYSHAEPKYHNTYKTIYRHTTCTLND